MVKLPAPVWKADAESSSRNFGCNPFLKNFGSCSQPATDIGGADAARTLFLPQSPICTRPTEARNVMVFVLPEPIVVTLPALLCGNVPSTICTVTPSGAVE
jgi:hypothetical protein